MKSNLTRWLIPLPALLFAFFPNPAHADPVAGLNAVGYLISGLPTKSDIAYPQCGSELENNINRNFNGEPFQQCGNDNFMVHYTGTITIPENQTISFMVAADDGGTVKIGDTPEFGTWNFKGCSWSTPTSFVLTGGTYPLDGWFFESGGLTCYMLAWNINGAGFVIVPDSAFTTKAPSTTTTTSSTSTTTTTLEPSTTTTELVTTSTSTIPATTTIRATTTSTTTTTIQETTTAPPTTIQIQIQQPQTFQIQPELQPTTTDSTQPPTTTSTSVPLPVVVVSTLPVQTATSSSMPQMPTIETTLPIRIEPKVTTTVSSRRTTLPEPTTPNTFVVPSTLPNTPTTLQPAETVLTSIKPPETTSLAPIQESKPTPTEVHVANLQQNIETVSAVIDIVAETISDPTKLETLSDQQIEQVFQELVVEELTVEQADQIVEALDKAPTKVKKAFENKVNVFSGLFNSYKMVGSTIPVGERRTLLAVSNTMVAIGASLRRREK